MASMQSIDVLQGLQAPSRATALALVAGQGGPLPPELQKGSLGCLQKPFAPALQLELVLELLAGHTSSSWLVDTAAGGGIGQASSADQP